VIVDLIDGTYELFRHFYGLRRFHKQDDAPLGAALGVVRTMVQMLEQGSTHIAVATDHIIESFRNELWPDYKTGKGIEPALLAQFHPMESALDAMGVTVWPMVELEADDALACGARIGAADERVQQVRIWTPDKDLAQCVRGTRVVQVDRRSRDVRDAAAVRKKFGVDPERIPDYLALVGDSADGYPGISGIGPTTAARLVNRHGRIEDFPETALGAQRERALLFKDLATLRDDEALVADVDDMRWSGPRDGFEQTAAQLGDPRLVERCARLLKQRA
jgi:5'-3' exonuclease